MADKYIIRRQSDETTTSFTFWGGDMWRDRKHAVRMPRKEAEAWLVRLVEQGKTAPGDDLDVVRG